eukprot:6928123-Pyramimonas_sp.AAC.1
MDDNTADTHPSAPEVAAPAPGPDYWEQRGYCIIRHIRTPLDQLDETRDFETTSTFEGEGVFRDVQDG